ncbi:MAG: glycerophosphodiester phosphodiesterase family protein [Thermoguttaceae bacterium]|nr:glycerophosphodiester phosphodiesterase family protein [Thermoguttaceae bacterium]
MTKKLALTFLSLFALLFIGAGLQAQEDLRSLQDPVIPRVVGHRGHSSIQPENTVLADRQCVETGANGCECDLMLTKDGKIVLFHDPKTDWKLRDAQGNPVKGEIADFDFATLRTYDVGIWKGEQFRGTQIATLDEYLDTLQGTDCIPVIELKKCPPEPVVEAVKARGMEKRCVFISASRRVKELCPEITTACLLGKCENVSDADLPDFLERVARSGNTNMIDIEHSRMTPEIAKELKKRGIYIMVWTVQHDPERLAELYKMGVDSITTDYPDEALEAAK